MSRMSLSKPSLSANFGNLQPKPGESVNSQVNRVVRDYIEISEMWRRWQMEDAVCTAVPVPDREPPKGWSGRAVLAGNMGSILPRPSKSKSEYASC
jgi:hypothetical protein